MVDKHEESSRQVDMYSNKVYLISSSMGRSD